MNIDEILNLKAGDTVGYKRNPDAPQIDCLVIQNGPRIDWQGKQIPYMGNVLVIQIGSGPMRMTWEPGLFTEGILELVPSTGPAPALFVDDPPPPQMQADYPHPPLPDNPPAPDLGLTPPPNYPPVSRFQPNPQAGPQPPITNGEPPPPTP